MKTARLAGEHAALKAASRLIRERGSSLTPSDAAGLARDTKATAPDCSVAACRRAVDTVIAKRLDGKPSRARRTLAIVASLSVRLQEHRRTNVLDAFERMDLRHSRAWEDDAQVGFGSPGATQTTTEGWIDYKRHGYRKGIVAEVLTLTVPADWGTRVRKAGLALLDGLFTLDAEGLPTSGPVEVYRATWTRQGRGVSLVTERGYIARHTPSGTTFHSIGRDPEKALRGLKRKLTALAVPALVRDARQAARQERHARQLARLIDQVNRHDLSAIAHVQVTRADSIRAGNCRSGTDAFIDRYGFDGRQSATIGEIATAIGWHGTAGIDLTLARQLAAACLQAIRKDKAARRLVLA